MSSEFQPNTTQTPNIVFELMPTLKDTELRVLLAIIRKTYGWRKDTDLISNSQIIAMTGIKRRAVQAATESLRAKGIIVKNGPDKLGGLNEYRLHPMHANAPLVHKDASPVQQNAPTDAPQCATPVHVDAPTKLTNKTNYPKKDKEPPIDDNPLNTKRLKPNASAICVEAMDSFNSRILKRKAQPDYTMWPAWVALAGDEQAAFETVMGIIHASTIPNGPRLPFQLDGVFRDPARAAYWRAQYKPQAKPQQVAAEPDYEAQTMQELENMTDAERAARFAWYAQTGLIAPQEAVKKWKHLMPNLTQSQAS